MSHDWKTKTAIRDGSSSGRFVVDWAEAEDFLHAAYEMTAARVVTGGLPDPMDPVLHEALGADAHAPWMPPHACPPAPLDGLREAGNGYEVLTWVSHQPSGVVVLQGHPQLGGRYCETDGGDWPCAKVRAARAALRDEGETT